MVEDENGAETQIATDYAFRSDWVETATLDRAIVRTTVCPLNVSNNVMEPIDEVVVLKDLNRLVDNVKSFKVYSLLGQLIYQGNQSNDAISKVNGSSFGRGLFVMKIVGFNNEIQTRLLMKK